MKQQLNNPISYSIIGLESLWKTSFVNKVISATKLLKNFKINNIELVLYSGISEKQLQAITANLAYINTKIYSIHLPKDMGLNTSLITDFSSFIKFAEQNSCNLLVIHVNDSKIDLNKAHKLYKSLFKICPKLKLLIENTANITNLFESAKALKQHNNFGLTLDLEHLYLRKEDILLYQTFCNYIYNIHFRDYSPLKRYVMPGKGIIDFKKIHSFINEYYQGVITIESKFSSIKDLIICNNFMNNFLGGLN